MYRVKKLFCDGLSPELWGDCRDWFEVEGDLDDFIFYDPTDLPPDPDWCK